jgi:predicted dienelactone hydrolase
MTTSGRWLPDAGVASLERRRAIFLAGSAALLAACGGPRVPRREEDSELKRFTERGYTAAATATAEPHRDMWLRGDEEIVIELLVPQSASRSPLVVYLPGLGEPVEAGAVWRNAWAQAGYAVASLQTGSGGALWSSASGRNGDFAKVAREQFAVKSLATWLDRVAFVLQGIVRRTKSGESFYARIDTDRIAVAGFDLGAQTALAFAGEKHPGMTNLPAMPGLRAVIALSPQAILARGGFAERFGDIRLPTLTITGTEDVDPYGIVESPHTRQAPFSYMPPGDKYLLVIEDGTHQLMAGGNRPLTAAEDANGAPGDFPGDDGRREPSGGMGRGGPGGGRGGMGGPGGGRGGMEGGPGGASGGRPDGARFRRSAGIGLQRQTVIIERVSVAFLDTAVKDDPVAREWLARDAGRWSDPLARLKMK